MDQWSPTHPSTHPPIHPPSTHPPIRPCDAQTPLSRSKFGGQAQRGIGATVGLASRTPFKSAGLYRGSERAGDTYGKGKSDQQAARCLRKIPMGADGSGWQYWPSRQRGGGLYQAQACPYPPCGYVRGVHQEPWLRFLSFLNAKACPGRHDRATYGGLPCPPALFCSPSVLSLVHYSRQR